MTCSYLSDSRLLAEPKEETAVSKAQQIWDIACCPVSGTTPCLGSGHETVMWGGELLCLPHVLENLMCVRVLLCLHMDTYMKTENLCYLFLHMCVHSFYAYVKINKIWINKITQLDAIHAFSVQMMKNHIPMKWGLCLYRSRPTDKTHWINVNLLQYQNILPSNEFYFFSLQFWIFSG